MSTQENPAQAAEKARVAPEVEAAATPEPLRRKRSPTGGFGYQLDAPQRPGYERRWVNADPLRVARMGELGYVPVAEQAAEGTRRTDGMGTRITRNAGKDNDGQPYQTILMETPVELFAQGIAEKEDGRKPFEEAIRRGTDPTGEVEGAYTPSTRSSLNNSG